MIYEYQNEETKEVILKELPMKDEIPSKIESDGKVYYRVWGSTVHIPYQWGQESGIKFDKSPSGKKHFF